MRILQRRWELKEIDCQDAGALSDSVPLLPLVAAILLSRGINTPDEARSFLAPALFALHDPYLMRGMDSAVARLLKARLHGETICIYGDYDVDGITGTTLLVSFLRETGFNCRYFIPNRFDDGYGLNADAITEIIAKGSTLIVSVDCGITAIEEALYCREQGIDLIIVDHHSPREVIPDASAVLNPLQPGCDYPYKFLAGVGVAFNLLIALRSALRHEGIFEAGKEPDLREWLDLVALGTIADIVPLTGQNRIYVYHGLRQLSGSPKPGIQALKKVAGVTGEVGCGQVGFRLVPRLNAAGRLESAVPGVDLLLCRNPEQCRAIAADLDAANAERQAIERRILDEAVAMIESAGEYPSRRSIVLAAETWHQGVIGIISSRLVERYHRPAILIALDDEGGAKGSGRSIPGFHLLDALNSCSIHLERFGGHRYAAGISLRTEHVAAFSAAFEAVAARLLTDSDLVPRLEIDVEARPEEVTRELAMELKRLAPFGTGNREPLLLMRGMKIMDRKSVGDGHLRLRLSKNGHYFNAIAFGLAARETHELVDIAFFPEMNEWNGNSSLQLRVKDLRPTE